MKYFTQVFIDEVGLGVGSEVVLNIREVGSEVGLDVGSEVGIDVGY